MPPQLKIEASYEALPLEARLIPDRLRTSPDQCAEEEIPARPLTVVEIDQLSVGARFSCRPPFILSRPHVAAPTTRLVIPSRFVVSISRQVALHPRLVCRRSQCLLLAANIASHDIVAGLNEEIMDQGPNRPRPCALQLRLSPETPKARPPNAKIAATRPTLIKADRLRGVP